MKPKMACFVMIVLLTSRALAGLTPPLHVTIDLSSVASQALELELSLYDNSEVLGDSWVLIDNVRLSGIAQSDFESGTLEGFDNSLNPNSVRIVPGSLGGTGQFLMRLDEDPVTFVTYTWRDFAGSNAPTLEFDLRMQASETEGFFGLDEFVVNLLDPNTLEPLLPQLPAGGILSLTALGSTNTPQVDVRQIQLLSRTNASKKGTVLVFPKVELRFNAAGELTQDTFLSLTNDLDEEVRVVMYFVSETCTTADNGITLTQNQPAYWSAATGLPGPNGGVLPFTILGAPYPDPEGSGDLVVRGFVVAWATDAERRQIRWNHLTGEATIVHYGHGDAWEYSPYAFQALVGSNGQPFGTPGTINFDGAECDAVFDTLLLDFFASGAQAFSGGGRGVLHDTELTLLIADLDFRQESPGPYKVKAQFDLWNENEISFSGMEYCVTKWDQSLLSAHGGHFLLGNLQTNKGKAWINGVQSVLCPGSTRRPLLGVAAKLLTFDGVSRATAGTALVGQGTAVASMLYDIPAGPQEKTKAKAAARSVPPNSVSR